MADLAEEISGRAAKALKFLFEMSEKYIKPENPLREAALHYPKGGGKGFRPAMLMLTCGAVGGNEEDAIPAAAAIEALHVSSLIHDDFMDNDETRRGIPSVWKKWDPTIAILAGDVLVGLAFRLVSKLKDLEDHIVKEILSGLALKYTELCHGQMLDIGFTERPIDEITIEDVQEMQYLKTGVLFEFCCVSGAQIGLKSLDHEWIDSIGRYAKKAGTAFQIQDDILGIVEDSSKTGKPQFSDLREGKRTIIAVHAFKNSNEQQKEILKQYFGNSKASQEELRIVYEIFEQTGSIQFAKEMALELAKSALQELEVLPESKYKKILQDFAMLMISREF